MAEPRVITIAPASMMATVSETSALREVIREWRRRGQRVALVPTMGALHRGHLSLVDRACKMADRVVVSIFVNPTQFNVPSDLEKYPRTPEADAALLAEAGCDLLFLPSNASLYPEGHSVTVAPGSAAQGLEGEQRPGHFQGVATIVCLLFNLVQPDLAVFGRKDAQQLAVVQQLVRDLHLPIEIVPCPTVREVDGLALSSRNRFLSPSERVAATILYRTLSAARERFAAGERSADALRELLEKTLAEEPSAEVEYAEVVDAESFRPVRQIQGPVVLPVAVVFGKTRLIDNITLDPTSPFSE